MANYCKSFIDCIYEYTKSLFIYLGIFTIDYWNPIKISGYEMLVIKLLAKDEQIIKVYQITHGISFI